MKKKIILSIIVTILIVILIILIVNINNKKTIKLTYMINAGIPFKWEYEIEDESIVKLVKSYVVKDKNKGGKVGAPIYTRYVFKGLKKGNTTITFKFISIDNKEVKKEEKHYIKVDKNNNVIEVERS